ncbi:MAG: HipA domain-containing protein [Sulfuritalea sp.]|nr:HipA domain-containing protein [Sulfuritalea sp.]
MRLEVRLDGRLTGWLDHEGATNRYAFAYSPAWLEREDAFPLSPHLPLASVAGTTLDRHSAAVRQFFENLLPEGQALDDAAAAYKVSKSNLAGLMAALGRETAGALAIVPETVGGAIGLAASRRLLSPEELSQRIRQRPQLPFSVWDGKVRLSIAGYQDKIAVLEEAGRWFLVEGRDLASTHILKPEPVNPLMAGLTSNEFFCMRLAAQVGLPVAAVRLLHVPQPVLAIARFDRRIEGDTVRRLHAIDGCQALGLPAGFKYERPYGDARDVREIRDGASLPRLFRLLAVSARPALEQRALLRWVIFQVLIGNTDAHAKNLTFMSGPAGLTLAKAYDLVCGLAFPVEYVDQTYAMAIGDAFSPADVSACEWARLCADAGLNPAQVKKELAQLAAATRAALVTATADAQKEGADRAVVARIATLIEAECARQQALAPSIPAMAKDLSRA